MSKWVDGQEVGCNVEDQNTCMTAMVCNRRRPVNAMCHMRTRRRYVGLA
jgi:hypothetical protein